MGLANDASTGADMAPRYYRLTPRGKLRAASPADSPTMGLMSPYLHDVLQMCGTGIWIDELRQFMPPRSLRVSIDSLLVLGLIECLEADKAPARPRVRSGARTPPLRTFDRLATA